MDISPKNIQSLYGAIRDNDPKEFNARLEACQAPPNFQNQDFLNPLLLACENGCYKIIPLLLNERGWFAADTKLGKIALRAACTRAWRKYDPNHHRTVQAFLPWVKRISTIKGVESGSCTHDSVLAVAESLGYTQIVNLLNKRVLEIEKEMESKIEGSTPGEHASTSKCKDVNGSPGLPGSNCYHNTDRYHDTRRPVIPTPLTYPAPHTTVPPSAPTSDVKMPELVRFTNTDDRCKAIDKIVDYTVNSYNVKAITMLYKHGLLSYANKVMDEIHVKVWNLIHGMSLAKDETEEKTFTRDWKNLMDVVLIDLDQNTTAPQDRIIIMSIIHQLEQRWVEYLKVTNKHPGSPELIEAIVKFWAGDRMFTQDDILELSEIAVTYDSDIMIEALLNANLRE